MCVLYFVSICLHDQTLGKTKTEIIGLTSLSHDLVCIQETMGKANCLLKHLDIKILC